ncbi:MAG: hypothetical protein V7676_16875 [Parasphingorhabdus sp.]|uniref:hypothetical protein n=1 Tax=Parasphingorhabdus sp. TaxID=2709688 RepID=UPI000C4C62AC|nr:hypothetical protein CHN51_06460 [Sphingorhabdus sp. YGSMI21]
MVKFRKEREQQRRIDLFDRESAAQRHKVRIAILVAAPNGLGSWMNEGRFISPFMQNRTVRMVPFVAKTIAPADCPLLGS